MIHKLKLNPDIEINLKELMLVQLTLLRYAASELVIHLEECKSDFDEQPLDKEEINQKKLEDIPTERLREKCKEYLEQPDRFPGRGSGIANWLYDSKDRRSPLLRFATCSDKGNKDEVRVAKLKWCDQISEQMEGLMNNENTVMRQLYRKKDAVAWKAAGAAFLTQFFEDFRNRSQFPAEFFSSAKRFGRQDFLNAFLQENSGLYICAVCDGSGYYSASPGTIYTEIEHYFPRSLYPHLAMHPYNLIPICGYCNNAHGDKDPFDAIPGSERYLQAVFLPYHDKIDLRTMAYLGIQLESDVVMTREGAPEFVYSNIESFKVKPNYNEHRVRIEKLLAALEYLYNIPLRWNKHEWTNKAGETLFRRMRQFLKDGETVPADHPMIELVMPVLDQMLCNLYEDDMGKDPFAFVMTWLLATIQVKEIEAFKEEAQIENQVRPAILQEIERWFKQDTEGNKKRADTARNLKKLI